MNNEEMSDVLNKFMNNMNSNISPDTISNLMQMLKNNNTSNSADNTNSEATSPQIDIDTLMKMKTTLEQSNKKDDPRANLLLSLKPYLKESRQSKVEQYIQLFNMSKMLDIFNKASGGDNSK